MPLVYINITAADTYYCILLNIFTDICMYISALFVRDYLVLDPTK